ncbi:MAG TPA: ATP-binding protein [Symbiobacteriaceae bacterium]|jgi:hypothetical protein
MGLHPANVFTPIDLPLKEDNVYAPRKKAEAKIRSAFMIHGTPIIYGDFGVGKTSTMLKIAQEDETEWEEFYFPAGGQKDFADFFKRFLEKQGYVVTKQMREVGGETGATLFSFLTAKASAKQQTQEELLVSSPTEDRVLELMDERRRIIIIDELHKASDSFKEAVAEFAKSLVNKRLYNIRLALIGTVHEPSELVKYDPGIQRVVQEVLVEPMNHEESAYIVKEGMNKCELLISKDLTDRIAHLSGGAPSVVHSLCLSAALHALAAGVEEISAAMVDRALEELLETRYGQHYQKWMSAIEKTGDVRWRKQILFAMALIPSEIVSTEELSATLSELIGRKVESSNYTYQMGELQNKFNIVSRVETTKKGAEYALWRFVDPSFKNLLKVILQRDKERNGQ